MTPLHKTAAGLRNENMRPTPASLNATHRTMMILEALSGDRHGQSITELSAELGVAKSIIHRIVASLSDAGYVVQDELSQQYKLTTKFMGLAFRHLRVIDAYDALLPLLRNLAETVEAEVELNWIERDRMITVMKAESPRRLSVRSSLGEEQPLHATACGKAWLANLPESEALRLVVAHGMQRFTEHTITDLATLQKELLRVRASGYATNREESGYEAHSVAAPVFVRSGEVVGSISVLAPSYREICDDERIIQSTIAAAREASMAWPFASLDRQSRP